jgi:hypothetical protein
VAVWIVRLGIRGALSMELRELSAGTELDKGLRRREIEVILLFRFF